MPPNPHLGIASTPLMPTVLLLPASFSRAKPKHWNSPRQNPQPEFDLSALQEWLKLGECPNTSMNCNRKMVTASNPLSLSFDQTASRTISSVVIRSSIIPSSPATASLAELCHGSPSFACISNLAGRN